MNKYEIERLLLEPAGIAKLSERAASIRASQGDVSAPVVESRSHVRANPLVTQERRAKPVEVQTNDADFVARSGLVFGVSKLVANLADAKPQTAVTTLLSRNDSAPTGADRWLLEDAVNRILLEGEPDADTEKLLRVAFLALAKDGAPRKRSQVDP